MARVQCAMVAVYFITLLLCERKSCTIQQQQIYFTTFAHRRLVCPQTCGRSLKVKDAMHCAFQCLKDTTCRSNNFGVSGDNTGLHECEVLWTDGVNSSNSLLLDGGYHHYSIQSFCTGQPCLDKRSCLPHYRSLYCKCDTSYKGTICEGCSKISALGLGSGEIPDSSFTASSFFKAGWEPWRGRLNHVDRAACWGPKQNRLGEYLQIDLGRGKYLVKIATQGRGNADYWTKAYKVSHSEDGVQWTEYSENGQVKEFPANKDRNTIVTNSFSVPFRARYLRIFPTKYYRWMDLRAELYGCDV